MENKRHNRKIKTQKKPSKLLIISNRFINDFINTFKYSLNQSNRLNAKPRECAKAINFFAIHHSGV